MLTSKQSTPLAETQSRTKQEVPPNIIFILSDDLGYGDYSISPGVEHPKAEIPTPNIQRLADNGMKFLRGYSGPVCAPSRCTLMTGRHMGRCTIRGNDGSFTPLLPADVTVAEVLRETHTTGIVGKWGLGDFDTTGYPTEQGFDYYVGQDSQLACHDWFPQFVNNNTKQYEALNDKRFLGPGCLAEGGGNCVWANDLVRDEAVAFIQNNAKGPKPFFLYVSTTTPHDGQLWNYPADNYPVPFQYTAASFIQPSWHPRLKKFAAAVWAQDVIVGAVLDELAAEHIQENTIVFFSGDNGPDMHNFHFFNDVGPFRGKKRSLHEGGTRQTIAVQWMGHIKPGTSSNHLFAFWDFLPTAADLAGVPQSKWPVTEGVSAAPVLRGHGKQAKHEYLYWEFCYYGKANGVLPQTYDEGWAQSLRFDEDSTEWKGIRVDRGPMQLWNLTADPAESHDLGTVAELEGVVRRMAEMMEEAHVENKHWPSVGEGSADLRCCDSCYNPQGIGCEPQCVPTAPGNHASADMLAASDEKQQIDSHALVGDWSTESGAAFNVDLSGTIATVTNVNDPDSCWQEGTGIFDADAVRFTAVVGADIKGCEHHIVGSVSRTTEEVRFDEDYKYHNVTYHIDWVTREGTPWTRWSRSVGLERAQSASAAARKALSTKKGDFTHKASSTSKKNKAPLKVVISEKHPLRHVPRVGKTTIRPTRQAHVDVIASGIHPTRDASKVESKTMNAKKEPNVVGETQNMSDQKQVRVASQEQAAEKKFAQMASKDKVSDETSGKATGWITQALDRLEELEGKKENQKIAKASQADKDGETTNRPTREAHVEVIASGTHPTRDASKVESKTMNAKKEPSVAGETQSMSDQKQVRVASQEQAAEKKFAEMASKDKVSDEASGKATGWITQARDRLDELEGKKENQKMAKASQADRDKKPAAEEVARESSETEEDKAKRVTIAERHKAAVVKQAVGEWARMTAAAKEDHRFNTTSNPNEESVSKAPQSRLTRFSKRIRAKIGIVQLSSAVKHQ